ncbi:MAG: sigma-E factor negative regulatory protein [Burkholderiales bacterium]
MNERLPLDEDTGRLALSVTADGECETTELDLSCSRWRMDEQARRDWHTYHLIGDVLRSDELGHPAHSGLLARVRVELANEPALLAPALPPAQISRSQAVQRALRRWGAPLGMAAGVALVASAVWVTRPDTAVEVASTQELARSSAPANAQAQAQAAQFERYVSAHKRHQSAALQGPTAGYLRSAVYDSSNDR